MTQRMHRALLGLLAGAAVGGLATGAELAILQLTMNAIGGAPISLLDMTLNILLALWMTLMIGLFAALAFAIGLVVVGLPAWAVLFKLGFRTRAVAILAGGFLSGIAAAILTLAVGDDGVWFTVLMLLPGAAAGWTLHRIAYGESKQA
jgi:hypothetical protein